MYFISYSSRETHIVRKLRTLLSQRGFGCWMAPESIPAGSDYASEIPLALRHCDAVILILSEASQRSMWVSREIDIALNEHRRVIPLHIDQSELIGNFRLYLCNIQRIEAAGRFDAAADELCAQLMPDAVPKAGPVAVTQPEVEFDFFDELRKRMEFMHGKNTSPISPNTAVADTKPSSHHVESYLQLPFCRKQLLNTLTDCHFSIYDVPDHTTVALIIKTLLNPATEECILVSCPLTCSSEQVTPDQTRRTFTLPPLPQYDHDGSNEWGDDVDLLIFTISHTRHTAHLNTAILSDDMMYVSEAPVSFTPSPLPSRDPHYMLNWKAGENDSLAAILSLNLHEQHPQSDLPAMEHVEAPFRQRCFSYLIIDPQTAQPIIPDIRTRPNGDLYVQFDFDPSQKYICAEVCPMSTDNTPYNFGVGYLMGAGGLRKDVRRAAEWFRKGADTTPPDPACAYELSCMLHDLPEVQDKEAARRYLTLAAEAGNHQAMFELARQAIEESGSTEDLRHGRNYLQQLIAAGRERSGEITLASLLERIDAALH